MRKLITFLLVAIVVFSSCEFSFDKTVKGEGVITTEQRSFNSAKKIKLIGNFDVQLTQSATKKITINAEANLLEFIETKERNGWLEISTKKDVKLKPNTKIVIDIETDILEGINIVGSGNFTCLNKFEGGEQLEINIAGSGDVEIATNTPKVEASIAGNGDVLISGETKETKVSIAGSGDYKGKNLKSELAKVSIAGSGNVEVFASQELNINIAGSGDVFYLGNPTITKKIAGSGVIKPLQ
jgi:hypothetical protein